MPPDGLPGSRLDPVAQAREVEEEHGREAADEYQGLDRRGIDRSRGPDPQVIHDHEGRGEGSQEIKLSPVDAGDGAWSRRTWHEREGSFGERVPLVDPGRVTAVRSRPRASWW